MAPGTESTPTFWGGERNPAQLGWGVVEARLRDALAYWLTSVTAGGRPVARPVWGVWHDDALWLSVGSVSHWRNVVDAGHDDVAVNLPSDEEVVILQGRVSTVTDPDTLTPFVEAYNAKYDWNFTRGSTGPVMRLDPAKIIAWTTVPAHQGTPDMDFPDEAGRWTS